MIGALGAGGAGNDRLMVQGGSGDAGDDVMSCHPQIRGCGLNGGAGNDVLTGGTAYDRLSGGGGRDLLLGGARVDMLDGGAGDDRLDGGAGQDELDGGAGGDRLESREDRRLARSRGRTASTAAPAAATTPLSTGATRSSAASM